MDDDCHPKYKVQSIYEQILQCWMAKYESINDDKNLAHYYEDLSINTYNNCILEFKSFYTKLK